MSKRDSHSVLFLFFIIVFLLLNAAAAGDDEPSGESSFFEHCKLGDVFSVKEALGRGEIDINAEDYWGHTCLSLAAQHGHHDLTEYLLTQAEPSVANALQRNEVLNGYYPLHWAASNGHEEIMFLLIQHLHYLQQVKHEERVGTGKEGEEGVEALSFSTDFLDVVDSNGRTCLHIACEQGRANIAFSLIQQGADVHVLTNDGKNALHYAAHAGLMRVCEKLIHMGINVHAKTKWLDTPFHYAAGAGKVDILDLLIEAADSQYKAAATAAGVEEENENASCSSDTCTSSSSSSLLPSPSLDEAINMRGQAGDTPLHWACWKGSSRAAIHLVSHGADPHVSPPLQGTSGNTAFSLGACGYTSLREKLLEARKAFLKRQSASSGNDQEDEGEEIGRRGRGEHGVFVQVDEFGNVVSSSSSNP